MTMLTAQNFLESLSVGSGACLVAILSAVLAWPLGYVRPALLRWAGAVVLPFVLATGFYWLPVWLGRNPSEYSSWALLFIGTWFLAGAGSSAIVLLFRGKQADK